MPVAVARYSGGRTAIRYVLPVLWMTSCFRVMTKSFPLYRATLYVSVVYVVVVCLSVCHKPVCIETTKRIKLV